MDTLCWGHSPLLQWSLRPKFSWVLGQSSTSSQHTFLHYRQRPQQQVDHPSVIGVLQVWVSCGLVNKVSNLLFWCSLDFSVFSCWILVRISSTASACGPTNKLKLSPLEEQVVPELLHIADIQWYADHQEESACSSCNLPHAPMAAPPDCGAWVHSTWSASWKPGAVGVLQFFPPFSCIVLSSRVM